MSLMSAARPGNRSASSSELREALAACWHAFIAVALMSGLINILYLTGSFYMLEVYDRVLPSRSIPTLIALSVLALALFAFQGILDVIRSRILVRVAASLDEKLSGRVYDIVVQLPMRSKGQSDGLAPLRDLDQIRSFLVSTGPLALFDLPWMPIYIILCFLFHPWIGFAALIGAVILTSLTILSEIMTRRPSRMAMMHVGARNTLADAGRRNAEVLQAMGMAPRMGKIWGDANTKYLASQLQTSDVAGGLGAVSKVLRLTLQSGVLGLGAYLVIQQQATAGIIIASSIIVARALAPVELAIANWRGFVAARQSWRRLSEFLQATGKDSEPMALPAPKGTLAVENVVATPPGVQRVVVQDVSFTLKAGQGLGIIGPSASGKSSLARLLVGVWAPARGKVRIDGAAMDQWSPADLGRHIGYLPQDVELFAGTVAQNIARFESEAPSDAIIAASQAAGVHDLIVRLPEGYDTQIGESGTMLSAGQRQRIALARALYRDPFLVVLDEPNSNLDTDGDKALTQAIMRVRARGGIVVVVAHRSAALAGVDQVLAMVGGRVHALGPRDEVLAKLFAPQQPAAAPAAGVPAVAAAGGSTGLRLVGEAGGTAP
ncbi:MAG: ATP-binding cassette, subfamily type secretion system permease/ATPase [Hyphomicrobiales bacterium]|nr:ATP-binding cassette, subfamily type secretion system permease/ATPase [Hyphomicrobiales bacterium]